MYITYAYPCSNGNIIRFSRTGPALQQSMTILLIYNVSMYTFCCCSLFLNSIYSVVLFLSSMLAFTFALLEWQQIFLYSLRYLHNLLQEVHIETHLPRQFLCMNEEIGGCHESDRPSLSYSAQLHHLWCSWRHHTGSLKKGNKN